MSDEARPEPDAIDGAPHPRDTATLIGQSRAEADFLAAAALGRLHHAWLITGPRGIGKATLAWRIARFLLTDTADDGGLFGEAPPPPTSLDVSMDHPVCARLAAHSEPRFALIRRAYDEKAARLKQDITVEEIRRLKNFFSMSATDGGRRVVIVDSADEMNVNAANALLKLLEEPPANVVILMISHQPSRLLPTIRSRCRELRCAALAPDDLATALQNALGDTALEASPSELTALAQGSVGDALQLVAQGGLGIYREIGALAASMPNVDRARLVKLADSAAGKNAQARFLLMLDLWDMFLARLARAGVAGPAPFEAFDGEADLLARLAPTPAAARIWATAQQEMSARARHGRAVNLDPTALILDMGLKMDTIAAKCAAR